MQQHQQPLTTIITEAPASDITSALEHVHSKLDIAALTSTTSDSHAALKSAIAGATLTVPDDARNGVSLDETNGPNSQYSCRTPTWMGTLRKSALAR